MSDTRRAETRRLEMRRWQIKPDDPHALQLAADARLMPTDYTDDQTWELILGGGDTSALQLQTRYGGRAGLASIVPMWWIDHRPVFQYQAYAAPPIVTAFAPGWIEVQGKITPRLSFKADFIAFDSQSIGCRFVVKNALPSPIELRLDVVGFAAAQSQEIKPQIAHKLTGGEGLTFGKLHDIVPLIVLEKGRAELSGSNPKLSITVKISANASTTLRWIHVGLDDIHKAFTHAEKLLTPNWTRIVAKIQQAAQAVPQIETGDVALDATIAFGIQQLLQSMLRPTMTLPYGSFVGTRQPGRGWSARGDGTDHPRAWSGQHPTLAYLTALGLASIDPVSAQGIVRNYLAVQHNDGFVDGRPGLAGQKVGYLCMPLLARMTWGIFQYTENDTLLKQTARPLWKFLSRWMQADNDKDGDGVYEWQDEQQTGYPFFPMFGAGLSYAQNADIRLTEAPDLAAYLLSEVVSLKAIASYLQNKTDEQRAQSLIQQLKHGLDSLWFDDRYGYRDFATHARAQRVVVVENGRGDEEQLISTTLTPPNRLIVRVIGGVDHAPNVSVIIDGKDSNGQPQQETLNASAFKWSTGYGSASTQKVFASISRIRTVGLSRVYRIHAHSVDSTPLDINAILPLWAVEIDHDKARTLVDLLTQPKHFWLKNGVSMVSTRDTSFEQMKTGEGGGVWMYWVTLIGEGLIEHGYMGHATELIKRVLRLQTEVLRERKAFYEFYHTELPLGLGERGHTAGVIPLHLLLRVLGVRVISPRKVWTGGAFEWGTAVTITQHGVTIRRAPDGTRVAFPSGYTVDLPAEAPMQEIIDPTPKE